MAELADAQDSGSCEGNLVRVQVPPRALILLRHPEPWRQPGREDPSESALSEVPAKRDLTGEAAGLPSDSIISSCFRNDVVGRGGNHEASF